MKTTRKVCVGGLVVALAVGVLWARDDKAPTNNAAAPGREADTEAIRATAREFAAAFNKQDAKGIAAQWTEAGEMIDAEGLPLVGRPAIEQAFADFFKSNPRARIEVLVESVRFPAPDLAIEDGMLRQSGSGRELPTTTYYTATHVRTGGRWLTATSREWGAGQDKLEDLDWLIGKWTGGSKDQQVTLTIAREDQAPYLRIRMTRHDGNKTVGAGSIQIGYDAQSGYIRSWHFGEDGAIGQSFWTRDGNHWVLDATGATAGGATTSALDLLGRLGPDEFTWQSTERQLNDVDLPNTTPIRFTRVR
jgi:uncharacterized protein (TIGR02246 family)